ncbi:uncharacterized protein LOC115687101 [Syzygium oleosum]|uniref:uncharacterized protein LOC115687101 n=1 Tax=Syzygium oleosum TaxID=219896 RepID=UPI0024BBCE4B|nr:uncharacterized protein LOC115687101 [Syzygium oleosum]
MQCLRELHLQGHQVQFQEGGRRRRGPVPLQFCFPFEALDFVLILGVVLTSQTYLGIRVFRFYLKCPNCSAEHTIKTDPRNSDYIVESGATRNFEPWRANDEVVEGEKRKRWEMADGMKSLENRTLDAKREMDIEAALHEMKSMNSRHATVSTDAMLQVLQRKSAAKEGKLEEEDEALTKSILFHTSINFLRRLEHEDLTQPYASDDESLHSTLKRKFSEESPNKPTDSLTEATSSDMSNNRGNYVGSRDQSASFVRIAVVKRVAPTTSTGLELVSQNYESSDDGD